MNKKYQEEKSEKINKKITTGKESKQREKKKEKRIACADCGGDVRSGEAANDHVCGGAYH